MEWYWWVVIATVLVAVGIAKYFIMKAYNSKRNNKKTDDEI